MNKRTVLISLFVAIVGAISIWVATSRPATVSQRDVRLDTRSTAASDNRSSVADRSVVTPQSLPGVIVSSSRPVPAILLSTTDWREAYDKLDSNVAIPPPERMFYKAMILDSCAVYQSLIGTKDPLVVAIKDGKLQDFKAQVTKAMSDPRQVAATQFNSDRSIANVCRGFAGMKITDQDVENAFKAAAAAGDLKAQAWLISRRLANEAIAAGQSGQSSVPEEMRRKFPELGNFNGGAPPPLTTAERDQLLNAIYSRDPVAIRTAGNVLSLGSDSQSLRAGPQQLELGPYSDQLWTLVACDFGFECGPRNMTVSFGCSQLRVCVDDYNSYLQQSLPARDYEYLVSLSQMISDAIRRQDFTVLQLTNLPSHTRVLINSPVTIRIR